MSVLGVYAIYFISGGDQEASGTVPAYTVTTYDNWPQYKYIGIYMLFSYFWTTTFITDMGTIGVASAACAWYFEDNGPVSLRSTVAYSTTSSPPPPSPSVAQRPPPQDDGTPLETLSSSETTPITVSSSSSGGNSKKAVKHADVYHQMNRAMCVTTGTSLPHPRATAPAPARVLQPANPPIEGTITAAPRPSALSSLPS